MKQCVVVAPIYTRVFLARRDRRGGIQKWTSKEVDLKRVELLRR